MEGLAATVKRHTTDIEGIRATQTSDREGFEARIGELEKKVLELSESPR